MRILKHCAVWLTRRLLVNVVRTKLLPKVHRRRNLEREQLLAEKMGEPLFKVSKRLRSFGVKVWSEGSSDSLPNSVKENRSMFQGIQSTLPNPQQRN
jgi:hypothetical protein